jgi:hypothetical protein
LGLEDFDAMGWYVSHYGMTFSHWKGRGVGQSGPVESFRRRCGIDNDETMKLPNLSRAVYRQRADVARGTDIGAPREAPEPVKRDVESGRDLPE